MAVETSDFINGFASRIILAAGARTADADEWELGELLGLEVVLKEAVQAAVDGQRARGKSWADIAAATGCSRQAAFQRWAHK